MYIRSARVCLIVLLVLVISSSLNAQAYKIDWYSINSGGGEMTGGAYKLNGSVGQSVAGFTQGASVLHWIGFWAGETPTPIVVPSINDAKLLADDTSVSVSGKIATSGHDSVSGLDDRFNGFFYLEESDRSSGIRVVCPSWPIAGLLRGSVINVIGTMGTTPEGERQISAPVVIITATTTPLTPVGMNNRAIGGSDLGTPPSGQYGVVGGGGLNNVGLLVQTWGLITGSGAGYLTIDDGSGVGIRVDTTGLAGVPTEGYISVIGLSSLYTGRLPLVLPRIISDIEPR